MNFLRGATSFDSILKAYKTSETKRLFPDEWFDHPGKMRKSEFSPYYVFYKKTRSCNHLGTKHTDYVNLFKNGMTTEQAVIKSKLSKPPPTGVEICQ